jgi:hypothetical protein
VFVVVSGIVVVVATAWVTGSLVTTLEVAAVFAVLIGAAIAFGALDRPSRPPVTEEPADHRTESLTTSTLESLDGIEHRRIELGTPWPQLLVGPTGVVVVDVCHLEGPLVVDGTGIHRRGERSCCTRAATDTAASSLARRQLIGAGLLVPVRTVLTVAPDTEVEVRPDARQDILVVSADQLADVLVRGPVLPMARVDAVFALLARTVTADTVAGTR